MSQPIKIIILNLTITSYITKFGAGLPILCPTGVLKGLVTLTPKNDIFAQYSCSEVAKKLLSQPVPHRQNTAGCLHDQVFWHPNNNTVDTTNTNKHSPLTSRTTTQLFNSQHTCQPITPVQSQKHLALVTAPTGREIAIDGPITYYII